MRTGDALAEDLRRLGLILLAAGIVSGFLQAEIPAFTALYTVAAGILTASVGYWIHSTERARESAGEQP